MNKLVEITRYFNKLYRDYSVNEMISGNIVHENILADINKFPHAIILIFSLDKDNKDGFLESLPYLYFEKYGSFSYDDLAKLKKDELYKNFANINPNFNENDLKIIINVFDIIKEEFNSNASNIWNIKPSSYILKQRLMMFSGINEEKANIISLLLIQKFKIKLSDLHDINVSYDKRIIKAMKKINLISNENSSYEEIKSITKKLNPDFPGIFDSFFYLIGDYILLREKYLSVEDNTIETIINDCINIIKEMHESSEL
ncbi:MAG: hypothetical protein ACRDCG_02425 [Mycoplasmoidaceae bacterium]